MHRSYYGDMTPVPVNIYSLCYFLLTEKNMITKEIEEENYRRNKELMLRRNNNKLL